MLLSVILPTYNEVRNLPILIPRLISSFSKDKLTPSEILVMDDKSPDETAKIARKFISRALEKSINLIVIEREGPRGLIPAVIDGMKLAKGENILTMDSDLSHPVSAIKDLVAAVNNMGADISIGSRKCPGGHLDPNWPVHRKLISFFSGLLGRTLDWRVTDPMSGFFCCSSKFLERVEIEKLKGVGFKILLEIIVRFKPEKIIEVPITFKDRAYGESKMNMNIMRKYVFQLISLYKYKIFH
ncbi:MAG: polyprenol monophosphomannose synthase [Promethearchaeota archaeon]